eukprot:2453717-Rhodomonas_salina.1
MCPRDCFRAVEQGCRGCETARGQLECIADAGWCAAQSRARDTKEEEQKRCGAKERQQDPRETLHDSLESKRQRNRDAGTHQVVLAAEAALDLNAEARGAVVALAHRDRQQAGVEVAESAEFDPDGVERAQVGARASQQLHLRKASSREMESSACCVLGVGMG